MTKSYRGLTFDSDFEIYVSGLTLLHHYCQIIKKCNTISG